MASLNRSRIITMWRQSTDGTDWYTGEGRNELQRIARTYAVPREVAVGVYAALSPNLGFRQCYRATERLLLQRDSPFEQVAGVSGFPNNRRKAWRIANGEAPELVLVGPKVRAFYQAILGLQVLVVDGHIINAWQGTAKPLIKVKVTAAQYRELVEDFEAAARSVGSPIREFQARVWNEQRRLVADAKQERQRRLL